MPVSCDPTLLAAAAVQFDKLSDRELMVVQAYLLQQAASNTQSVPQVLASAYAAGYPKLSDRDLLMCLVYLLCIASGGT